METLRFFFALTRHILRAMPDRVSTYLGKIYKYSDLKLSYKPQELKFKKYVYCGREGFKRLAKLNIVKAGNKTLIYCFFIIFGRVNAF